MNLSQNNLDAYFHLLIGGALIVWAVSGLVRNNGARKGFALWMVFGAAFIGLGSLDLLRPMAGGWVLFAKNVLIGLFVTVNGAVGLLTTNKDRAAYWLLLVTGFGAILLAVQRFLDFPF